MEGDSNNVLAQPEISLEKFKQLVQEDLGFSSDLKIEYGWGNCSLIVREDRHLQAAVNYFRGYNSEDGQFTVTDLNQLSANGWFSMHKGCICNVLTKSAEQASTSPLQSAESSQGQKRDRSPEKPEIGKLINDLLRQNLPDHNVGNDSEKSSPGEKRVKGNTIEADFWEDQMQGVEPTITKGASEPRLSTENIHAPEPQTSSQTMHDSEPQFKPHLTHDLGPKASEALALLQKPTNPPEESSSRHEPAATPAANLTPFKSKVSKTTPKIDDDVIELTDDDDEGSAAQPSHDRYDRYDDLLEDALLSEEEEMPLSKDEE